MGQQVGWRDEPTQGVDGHVADRLDAAGHADGPPHPDRSGAAQAAGDDAMTPTGPHSRSGALSLGDLHRHLLREAGALAVEARRLRLAGRSRTAARLDARAEQLRHVARRVARNLAERSGA